MGRPPATHLALPAVGQQLVLVPGVEHEGVRTERHVLSLEGGTFVSADEEYLVLLIQGGAHQNHLETSGRSKVVSSGHLRTTDNVVQLDVSTSEVRVSVAQRARSTSHRCMMIAGNTLILKAVSGFLF